MLDVGNPTLHYCVCTEEAVRPVSLHVPNTTMELKPEIRKFPSTFLQILRFHLQILLDGRLCPSQKNVLKFTFG